MKFPITKSAKQFGYLIWNNKNGKELEKILENKKSIRVTLNGFELGEKNIDAKYHRISLGYKLTRALPSNHDTYSVVYKNEVLEVKTLDGSK